MNEPFEMVLSTIEEEKKRYGKQIELLDKIQEVIKEINELDVGYIKPKVKVEAVPKPRVKPKKAKVKKWKRRVDITSDVRSKILQHYRKFDKKTTAGDVFKTIYGKRKINWYKDSKDLVNIRNVLTEMCKEGYFLKEITKSKGGYRRDFYVRRI